MRNIMKDKTTSEKVLLLLVDTKKSKHDIADLLSCHFYTVKNRLEKNDWKMEEIKKLASFFDVKANDLL